jgi:hypothetical protein
MLIPYKTGRFVFLYKVYLYLNWKVFVSSETMLTMQLLWKFVYESRDIWTLKGIIMLPVT